MAEKTLMHQQKRTKESRLVIPLDHPRSFDYGNATIATASTTSGALYTACSGRDVYIKELIVTEYSNTDSKLRLTDASGNLIPFIPVGGEQCVTWQPRPAVLGPIHGPAGAVGVYYVTDGAFYGEATVLVQIDPQVDE